MAPPLGSLSAQEVLPVNSLLLPFICHRGIKTFSSSQASELELICLQNRGFDSILQLSLLEEFTHLATSTAISELMTFFFFFLIYFTFGCFVSLLLCAAFSSCSERGPLFVAVRRLLIAVASRCRAQALGVQASVVVARGL